MDILSDDRLQWMRQKVVLSLDISIDCFNEHFIETLERARSAGIAREQVGDFFSEKCGSGTAIFFASHQWTEQVEGNHLLIIIFKYKDVYLLSITNFSSRRS